jgi:hypothetical protein
LLLSATTNVKVDLRRKRWGRLQQRNVSERQQMYSQVLAHWLGAYPKLRVAVAENSGDSLAWTWTDATKGARLERLRELRRMFRGGGRLVVAAPLPHLLRRRGGRVGRNGCAGNVILLRFARSRHKRVLLDRDRPAHAARLGDQVAKRVVRHKVPVQQWRIRGW